jgi:hypothetical protein
MIVLQWVGRRDATRHLLNLELLSCSCLVFRETVEINERLRIVNLGDLDMVAP